MPSRERGLLKNRGGGRNETDVEHNSDSAPQSFGGFVRVRILAQKGIQVAAH
jgi:hypothetical protein